MADFKKINSGEITLGEPLPYSVYDKSGMLLLKAGFVINTQRHLDNLLESGLFLNEGERAVGRANSAQPVEVVEAKNSFELLDVLKIQLKNIFEHVKSNKAKELFVRQITSIAVNMQEACTHDTDAALANLHLDHQTSYIVVHSLQAAMICELIGKRLNIPEDKRLTVICAALTQGVGVLDIQDILDKQNAPLSPQQKARIHAHPFDGVAMLASLGVSDPLWLGAVQQHHERLDGSGYPCQLAGDDIKTPARLLAVADTYSAMVRVRPYRKALLSKEVMRNMLVEQKSKIDQRIIEVMIKVLGIFPPGAIVKLSNGEVAVVKKQQDSSSTPVVYAFCKSDGMPRMSVVARDTRLPECAVEGIVGLTSYLGCLGMIRGIWLGQ